MDFTVPSGEVVKTSLFVEDPSTGHEEKSSGGPRTFPEGVRGTEDPGL